MVQESGDAHMTDGAPKRIWAWITGIQPLQGNAGLWRSDEWTITDDEYILAAEHARIVAKKDAEIERLRETAMPTDVLDEVERALVNAGVVLHRAQVTATMDCINASVSDPLRKNIENWRARCVMAECDAGTALDRIRAAREGK